MPLFKVCGLKKMEDECMQLALAGWLLHPCVRTNSSACRRLWCLVLELLSEMSLTPHLSTNTFKRTNALEEVISSASTLHSTR